MRPIVGVGRTFSVISLYYVHGKCSSDWLYKFRTTDIQEITGMERKPCARVPGDAFSVPVIPLPHLSCGVKIMCQLPNSIATFTFAPQLAIKGMCGSWSNAQ